MNNILVTGATGLVGSHLLKSFNKNDNVIAMVHDKHKTSNISADHIVAGDIKDYNFLCRVISEYEITNIYHCAAQAIVRSCAADPLNTYETNVMGTVKLLEAVRTVDVSHIKSIIISTSDKAISHSPVPYTEETPLRPKYTYEASKACQDFVAQNYFFNYNLPIKIVRCSNIYGPGDPNESRLIPGTIKRILNNEKPLIYSDVANYVREFIYIDDVISAFRLIDNKALSGDIYCVGGTEKIKVKDLVQKIIQLSGKTGLLIDYPIKHSFFKEIEEQYIDASKLKKLGWTPKFSLDEGLLKTINYYQQNA